MTFCLAYRGRVFLLSLRLFRALIPFFPLLSECEHESEASLPLVEAVPLPSSLPFFCPIVDEPLIRPGLPSEAASPTAAESTFLLFVGTRFALCFRFGLGPSPPRCFAVDCLRSIKALQLSSSSQVGGVDFAAAPIAALAFSVLLFTRLVRAVSRAISFSNLSAFLAARSMSLCLVTYF